MINAFLGVASVEPSPAALLAATSEVITLGKFVFAASGTDGCLNRRGSLSLRLVRSVLVDWPGLVGSHGA